MIEQQQTEVAPAAVQRPRDPQSFMRSDKIAITVAILSLIHISGPRD